MSEEEIINNIENIKFFLGDLKASNYNLSFIESVENLIEENKKLLTELQENKCIKDIFKQLYIPKSKVEEKIKEYNIPIFDVLDKLPIMPRTIERGCGAKDGIIYVLQELLEEGE